MIRFSRLFLPYLYIGTCWYNGDNSVCGFSIFVGVLAFLACTAFFLADAYFENITSVQQRKLIVMGDLGFSGVIFVVFFSTETLFFE